MVNAMHIVKVFSVRYCETLEDPILDCLANNIETSKNQIQKLVLRKGENLTTFGFEILFSRELSQLTYLNLDECKQIEDSLLELLAKNCKNL